MELESALIQSFDLQYATQQQVEPIMEKIREVAKLINGLLRSSINAPRGKKFSHPVNR